MQVAFLADLLYYRLAAGTTRYCVELLHGLESLPDISLDLFTLYPPEVIKTMAEQRGYPEARSTAGTLPRPLQYLLWHTLGYAGASASTLDNADVVHTPLLLVPPRRHTPLVVTVHDLTFRLFPEHHSRWSRTLAEAGLRRVVRTADAVLADSQATACDLIAQTGIRQERVHVVPCAADARFRPVGYAAVLPKYGIDAPYALYVGTLEPRKNLIGVLEAFARLDLPDVKLVVVGAKGWMYDSVFATVEKQGLASRVIFTGYVPDEDLPALMSGAGVFVYPSFYEGFGLPVLEAMQCGAPVITSNVSSLPEVAGDAALLVDPKDVCELSQAMRRLLTEPGLREEFCGRGLEQAQKFSWQRTAEMTAQVYSDVARGALPESEFERA